MSVLDQLRLNSKKRAELADRSAEANREMRVLVRQAFEEGQPGPAIAEAVSLSIPRVYQLRDGRR